MSPEVAWLLKVVLGVLFSLLVGVYGYLASHSLNRIKTVEEQHQSLKEKLLYEYPDKHFVEKQIQQMMLPTNQRLDTMISNLSDVVSELKKLNDRLIRVETQRD